jgi:cell wall assembly regulator SMI1
MSAAWKRIEAWLKKNAPDTFAALRPGASDDDVEQAERALGRKLPKPVVDSYKLHDGMRGGAGPLVDEWSLMALATVVREWKTLKKLLDDGTFEGTTADAAAQIKSTWWSPGWIPIAGNGSGDYLCVDLDPEPGGKAGQVISFLHADPHRELVAKDLPAWLAQVADAMKAGKGPVRER